MPEPVAVEAILGCVVWEGASEGVGALPVRVVAGPRRRWRWRMARSRRKGVLPGAAVGRRGARLHVVVEALCWVGKNLVGKLDLWMFMC